MPDIKDMRRWARGEGAAGLPKRDFKARPAPEPALAPPPAPGPVSLGVCGNCGGEMRDDPDVGPHCVICLAFGKAVKKYTRKCKACGKLFKAGKRELIICSRCEAVKALSKRRGPPKYKISADGEDALLQFGKHTGKTLSALAKGKEASYLDFLITERDEDDRSKYAFPDDLRDVARHQKKVAIELSRKIKLFEDD